MPQILALTCQHCRGILSPAMIVITTTAHLFQLLFLYTPFRAPQVIPRLCYFVAFLCEPFFALDLQMIKAVAALTLFGVATKMCPSFDVLINQKAKKNWQKKHFDFFEYF